MKKTITFDTFIKEYEPIENDDGNYFFDVEKDHKIALQASIEKRCWTLIEKEGDLYIRSGKWQRHRVEYLITTNPWKGKRGNIIIEY